MTATLKYIHDFLVIKNTFFNQNSTCTAHPGQSLGGLTGTTRGVRKSPTATSREIEGQFRYANKSCFSLLRYNRKLSQQRRRQIQRIVTFRIRNDRPNAHFRASHIVIIIIHHPYKY